MSKIQLQDITLMSCQFSLNSPEIDDGSTEGAPDLDESYAAKLAGPYPEEQLLELAVESGEEGGLFYSFIEGRLDDDRLPFTMGFEMGFKFDVPTAEDDQQSVADLEPTFIWLAFPYMRQLIADMTGRAPFPQYFAPPLSRLPKPDDIDEEAESSPGALREGDDG
jgi:hypothetical protein